MTAPDHKAAALEEVKTLLRGEPHDVADPALALEAIAELEERATRKAWIPEYVERFPKGPPKSPDVAEMLLADPTLRAVFYAAGAVMGQEEGLVHLACGLSQAVSGMDTEFVSRLTDHGEDVSEIQRMYDETTREDFLLGYALGLQIVWAVRQGFTDGEALESVPGLLEPEETIEAWIHKWRDAQAENRKCRGCGCMDHRACLHSDGTPCSWVELDLCSVCAEKEAP